MAYAISRKDYLITVLLIKLLMPSTMALDHNLDYQFTNSQGKDQLLYELNENAQKSLHALNNLTRTFTQICIQKHGNSYKSNRSNKTTAKTVIFGVASSTKDMDPPKNPFKVHQFLKFVSNITHNVAAAIANGGIIDQIVLNKAFADGSEISHSCQSSQLLSGLRTNFEELFNRLIHPYRCQNQTKMHMLHNLQLQKKSKRNCFVTSSTDSEYNGKYGPCYLEIQLSSIVSALNSLSDRNQSFR
ncbi:hypothetical protein TrispH2_004987 [Trichoplax sp. H2]|nr:hypothetical protein TrispH2_004987 [Trichoplax sp. H2]|eukprot:RDD43524.1 hypothetical protein TrispH2_004987 [Trichoplax sp. H2]